MCENIKVAVRVRPLVDSEKDRGSAKCVETITTLSQVIVNNDRRFSFNYVFGDESTQEEVYETAVQGLVKKLFHGYNVTVFAYGQTGSGKTHTMGSSHQYSDVDAGVIPRAVDDIFKYMDCNQEWEFKITVAFMELYKEQLYDLLAKERVTVDIREDTKGICIPSLTEMPVSDSKTTMECLLTGSKKRVTGATAMNSQSSRSHAIFTITINQQKIGDANTATQAKFHLVDLAGSERSKKTQAEGERFKEGVTINSGLLALGNVIAALGEGSKAIPSYRTSKLTRLLQDSLGGNSMTLMIACVSPSDCNTDETLNTLRYADRARQIKNKPVVNQDPRSAEIVALKQKVAQLQLQLASQGGVISDPEDVEARDKQIKELEAKLRVMRQSVNELLIENAAMRERMLLAESARDRLKDRVNELQSEMISKFESVNSASMPENIQEHLKTLKKSFTEKFTILVDEQKRCEEEQRQHETVNGFEMDLYQEETGDDLRQLDEQHEQHTMKQCKLNNELRQVEKELMLKVERCEQYAKTNFIASTVYMHSKAEAEELEKKIGELEKEKAELELVIKQLQVAKKEDDAQAKRSELLKKNAEIEAFKKKLAEQAKIVKQKEMAEKKVEELKNEILKMKQLKVKLIKDMKSESDQFKIWRTSRDRETEQLRQTARKQSNEMARMRMMHDKLQNVSKRKLEQAVAANKRLKEALAKQNSVRVQRGKRGNQDQVQEFVSREVEVLVSTVDARRSLHLLLEDREALTSQLTTMRRLTLDAAMRDRLTAIEQDIELRNAQIADLQNKLADFEDNKSKTNWDVVGTMADAKIALSHAVRLAADYRAEVLKYEALQAEIEQKAATEQSDLKEKLQQLEKTLALEKQQHHAELLKLEKERQETFGTLLADDKENNPVNEDLRKKVSTLQNQLDTILNVTMSPHIRRKRASVNFEAEDLNLASDGQIVEQTEVAGTGWRQSALGKRLASLRSTGSSARGSFGLPFVRCACKGACATKRCLCFNMKKACDEHCSCFAEKCRFKVSANYLSLSDTYTVDDDDSSAGKRLKLSDS